MKNKKIGNELTIDEKVAKFKKLSILEQRDSLMMKK
jgi:hypothetical protein